MTAPALTETGFQQQVTQLADMFGWYWLHLRPARTKHGWRTPISGSLGAGWPDMVLVRERDHRLIFAELKAEKGKPTDDQAKVLALLGGLPSVQVFVWYPTDLAEIARVLR